MGGRALGYNIKYIVLEGNKTPTLFYEVTPGNWVPRSQIPESIEYRKRTYNKRRAKDFEYLNTERGYIRALFSTSRKSARKKNQSFDFKWEEWWQHWLDQKKKWGWVCPYTRVTMTTVRGAKKRTLTNISADRINVKHGYTPVNTIFCTWDANNKKGSVSIDMCQAILDLYNDSIEENFVNKYRVKKMGYKEQHERKQ